MQKNRRKDRVVRKVVNSAHTKMDEKGESDNSLVRVTWRRGRISSPQTADGASLEHYRLYSSIALLAIRLYMVTSLVYRQQVPRLNHMHIPYY